LLLLLLVLPGRSRSSRHRQCSLGHIAVLHACCEAVCMPDVGHDVWWLHAICNR
jgi:hypothetical protein